jgi:hypothetical protein
MTAFLWAFSRRFSDFLGFGFGNFSIIKVGGSRVRRRGYGDPCCS